MELILRETSLYYNDQRVADLNFVEGQKAYLDNPVPSTIIVDGGEFDFDGVENLANRLICLTHEWPEPSMSREVAWTETISANGLPIGISILEAVDVEKGRLGIKLVLDDVRFTADCLEYDIDCSMQNMKPEEVVASFYVATRHILSDIKLA